MDYKDTLILPETTFPMRGNLPQNEPKTYQKWKDSNVYAKMKKQRAEAPSFNLHDGPPYANGHIHIGHALNKILKDIIVKIHYFHGKNVRYTPGWDCHGLPIEQQVEKNLGKAKKDSLPKSEVRALCREHAKKFLEIQSEEFQQLGVLGDFENPYKTMDFAFESNIYRVLCEVAKKGLLIERSKPIYWSWACETALADAEVEYHDKVSDSIFVAFDLSEQSCEKLGIAHAKAVIWTTTPWTLPANQAICLNPHAQYVLTGEGLIFAKPLLQSAVEKGLSSGAIAREFAASELENLIAKNPLNGRDSVLILGEHVTMDGGSGLVHSAPGHGEDDYYICLKYGITDVLMPVDDKGRFSEDLRRLGLLRQDAADELVGMHIFKAQDRILELLGDSLLLHTKITHSYPYCWRSHEPVIYRATKQWFILMDKPFLNGKTLRELALSAIDSTTFYPAVGKNRIRTMVENRPDWCISRQRDWGVPIAFFRDKTTQEVVLAPEVLDFVADTFAQHGCDAWWDKTTQQLLPPSWQDKAENLERCDNILDVWFDSGSTWQAVLKSGIYDAGDYPADVYLEGSDQHRGWFQSSLLLSCILQGHAPYRNILTHGFTMDENGEKMSKSKGNVIAPEDVRKEFGSEILRLWVALCDFQNDQKVSQNILKQTAENYRKIRNTLRFLLANTSDLPELSLQNLSAIDCWILQHAKNVFGEASAALLSYDFSVALPLLSHFIVNELSGIYLDLCKDILYCDAPNSPRRRAAQSVMALIAQKLFELLAPILTYTIDEAITHARGYLASANNDVFELLYTPLPPLPNVQNFEQLLAIRSLFLEKIDALKKSGAIKSTLEVSLVVPSDFCFGEMGTWLMVSEVGAEIAHNGILAEFECEGKRFALARSRLHKCPRCWQFLAHEPQSLCPRCAEVVHV